MLVFKDMTSLLSQKNSRDDIFSAFREIHDGAYSRLVGAEGGRRVEWKGRCTVMAACTTEWDRAHEAIASLGDRFLVVRFDSEYGRHAAFNQAQANNGHEREMRQALAQAVNRVKEEADRTRIAPMGPDDQERLFQLSNLVTRVRTAVARDWREDVLQAHAPEMPTRFGKQLAQLIRGGMALGLDMEQAFHLAARAASDSLPPIKWRVLKYVYEHPGSTVDDVRIDQRMTYTTTKRTLDALMVQRLVRADEVERAVKYTVVTEMISGLSEVLRSPTTSETVPW
jgi:DNA-binding MarR family transcriptional regulator